MNIEHIPTRAEIRARRERLGCYGVPEPMPEKLSPIEEMQPVTEPAKQRTNIWFNIVGERPINFLTLADIRDAVCQHFGIDYLELCKHRRLKLVVYRRSIAIYLARELTPRSWPQIAAMFGGLDHTSAISAGTRIEKAIGESDAATLADIAAIRATLGRLE